MHILNYENKNDVWLVKYIYSKIRYLEPALLSDNATHHQLLFGEHKLL